jgi:hypothetical protein
MFDVPKKPIHLELPEQLVKDIDHLARSLSLSRVALINQACAALLASYGYTGYERPIVVTITPKRETIDA